MRKTLGFLLSIGLIFPLSAAAQSTLVKFKGGIGVHPLSAGQGTATTATVINRNIVRGVQPPGQPWVIADLSARVKTDGSIRVKGKGLLLAGGNGVGTTGGQSVFATLICEGVAPFTERNTSLMGVPLQPNGDFEINDILTPAPFDCASPVLLIRNVTAQAWFAAGILQLSDDD
jgi:hypothetical protein